MVFYKKVIERASWQNFLAIHKAIEGPGFLLRIELKRRFQAPKMA